MNLIPILPIFNRREWQVPMGPTRRASIQLDSTYQSFPELIQLVFFLLMAHLCLKSIAVVVGGVLSCVALCCKPHTMKAPRHSSCFTLLFNHIIHPSSLHSTVIHQRWVGRDEYLNLKNIHKPERHTKHTHCSDSLSAEPLWSSILALHVYEPSFGDTCSAPRAWGVCSCW